MGWLDVKGGKSRPYKPNDVARIARYCLNDNPQYDKYALMAKIARAVGVPYVAVPKLSTVLRQEEDRRSKLIVYLEQLRDKIDSVLRGLGLDV